nr:ribonuclease H-like domain-containing protein [Tanacetum cinerariifolium]
LRFSKYETAKELWEAILKAFGGKKATKKTKKNQLKLQYGNFKAEGSETLEQTFNRLQAIMSHLEFMDAKIEQDDLNQKFLTSLAPEWQMYTIVWRNRDDLDTMSLDDVYNHLKVYKPEVQKKSESNSQNMAFISSSNTSGGKSEVSTASVPTASTQVSTASTDVAVASLSHDTTCTWNVSISTKWVILLENVEHLEVKTEEREKATNKEENNALVAKDEVPTEFALMAKSSSCSDNEVYDDSYCSKSCRKNTENLNTKISKLNKELSDCETDLYNYKRGLSQVKARLVEFKEHEVKFREKIRGLERDVEIRDNKIEYLKNELEQETREKLLRPQLVGFRDLNRILLNKDMSPLEMEVERLLYRKSTTGGCQFLGRRLISWQCKKQTIMATSTTETEYVTAASGCGQVLWIQNQMLDYGLSKSREDLYEESTSYVLMLIETMNQETKILATIDSKPWTISESSLRRNLKLNDESIWIAQSKALSPTVDEPASLSRDNRQGDAYPTVSSLDARSDRENIPKTSALPHESSPRVTSLDADEGSMQQRLHELMELCTSLQRQQSQMAAKIKDQDLEIFGLKASIKSLEDKERRSAEPTQEDAPIPGEIKDIAPRVLGSLTSSIKSQCIFFILRVYFK